MVGEKISAIRESKKLSIEELALRSDLSTEQLMCIENDEQLPALSPLIKIARAMGVPIGEFMDENNSTGPIVTLKDETDIALEFLTQEKESKSSLNYLSLAGQKSGRHMEPFLIDITPKSEGHKISQHEGEEFIFVLEGHIEIEYGTEKIELTKGDSIYYDSDVSHHIYAKGRKAKILATIYAPS